VSARAARTTTTVLGVGYAACAVFNLLVTVPMGPDAYFPNGFADSAWLGPYQWLLEHVLAPNAVAFGLGLVMFELLVAAHLLMRGKRAEDGLLVATVFVLLLCPALSLPGIAVNLVLAAVQLWCWHTLQAERTGVRVPRLHHA
jgi:hypothetical protein